MGMQTQTVTYLRKFGPKILLWALVAVYTYMLPDAIVVYRAIVGAFGQAAAGKVPLVIVAIVGAAYAAAILISHRSWKNLLFLVPCGIIAFLIMRLVDNPNKHIHIPEYVLMAWLLYAVLSRDHKGKGLLILIFIYATMLGVVDEMEQGINPARFYGLSDMLVNSSSALIGVFTIMGLKQVVATDWSWTAQLKQFKTFLGLDLFGFTGVVITCAYLFRVQAEGKYWGVYPTWLWVWNIVYFLAVPSVALYRGALPQPTAEDGNAIVEPPGAETARLWTIPMLLILLYMHALAIYVSGSGVKFN
jgi:hypothetical protein